MNIAMAGSFGLLFALSAAPNRARPWSNMQAMWPDGFPPLAHPLKLAWWLIEVHAGDLLAYPFGGGHGGSTLTLVCVAVALVALCRRRQFGLVFLCLAPLGLTLVAAALRRYPYGQMVKFQIDMAPAFCILGGIGAALIALWLARARIGTAAAPIGGSGKRGAATMPAVMPVAVLLALLALSRW